MPIDKPRLEFFLNQAREWLDPYPMPKVELRRSSQLLLGQMQQALRRSNPREVRWFIDRLAELSKKIQRSNSVEHREPAVIKIECAIAAYQMNNCAEAVEFLEGAMQVYEGGYALHFEAVIRSMLGCIQWQLSQQGDNAIVSWEKSIEIYKELQQRSNGMALSGWYADRLTELNSILELALEPSAIPSPSAPSAENPSMNTTTSDASPTLIGDVLRLFYVLEEVQAGPFGRVAANPSSFGQVELEQCNINGVAHYIVNLRATGKVIKISWDKNYGVIKVKGESMNARGVDDGDYVLLHFQNNAEHGDIVAAQIVRLEAEATLKIFLKRENDIILQFCSNNKMYKHTDGRDMEFQFSRYNHEKFQIVGVALAVFKAL